MSVFEFLELYKIELCHERKVADVIATTSLCNENIYGFQNTEYLMDTIDHILFSLSEGYGNHDTGFEGYMKNNFYATSIIGPILARNDNFCEYIVNQIKKEKEKN